ncbi:MAG: hypothetical protein U5L11_09750 [Arhodomonas sp.]|nr:hypothetical protein [Arhodomonas sp.]
MFLNPRYHQWDYAPAAERVVHPGAMPRELAAIAGAVAALQSVELPKWVGAYAAEPDDGHREVARRLVEADDAAILTGALVEGHPAGAELRALAALVARLAGATLGVLGLRRQ